MALDYDDLMKQLSDMEDIKEIMEKLEEEIAGEEDEDKKADLQEELEDYQSDFDEDEYEALQSLEGEASKGAQLLDEDEFRDYVEDLIPEMDAKTLLMYIDVDKLVRDMSSDYSVIEYQDTEYYVLD